MGMRWILSSKRFPYNFERGSPQGDTILVQTILTELKHRSALPQALHNRSPETLQPILKWSNKYINDPRYTPVIIDILYHILGNKHFLSWS